MILKKVIRKGLTTDKNGKISASDLRPGDYQFIEVKAPKRLYLKQRPYSIHYRKKSKKRILLLLLLTV